MENFNEASQQMEVKTQSVCPLLVRVQSIDIQKLNFKSGAPRNRHVTCIEASNQFVFLGCISGTVYVYSRKELQFLFIIPFKGGKVCNISSSENEDDVAVGSVRGIISVFRISRPNAINREPQIPSASFLTHLLTISHHNQNEITEIIWSPNGKFLFTGDNQGLISQVDVGNFDEFSTNIPSKVILKLKSRIVQLSFIFPYLAVSTVSGVYLCDIENEQFTRIQIEPKIDLKSTGICIAHMKKSAALKNPELVLSPLQLIVGEASTGCLHSFDMEGVKISSTLVNTNGISVARPTKLFDPISNDDLVEVMKPPTRPESSQVLGKLFVTDDGFIVSTCHDHCLYLIETSHMRLVLWSEEFQRINNLKILSNYMFIGSGSQVNVVSLTQFRLYGEQLLKAGLTDVLHRWIQHAILAMGFHTKETCQISSADSKYCECDNQQSKNVLRRFLSDTAMEDDEFSLLVARHLPFNLDQEEYPPLIEKSVDQPKATNLFVPPLKNFIVKLNSQRNTELQTDDLQSKPIRYSMEGIFDVFESLARFYEVQTLLPVCMSNQENLTMTLPEIISSIKEFYKETNILVNSEDFRAALSETISDQRLGHLIIEYTKELTSCRPSEPEDWKLISPHLPMFFNFTKFSHQNDVQEWLSSFETQLSETDDSILADAIVLLMPLLPIDLKLQIWTEVKPTGFFSWLVYAIFCNVEVSNSYDYLRSSFLTETMSEPAFSTEIVSRIYRDFLGSDFPHMAKFLHHFISVIYFIPKVDQSKENTLKLLLSCFPLKHWSDSEIEQKMRDSCHENPLLLNMLKQACLSDGKSIMVCDCGFPVDGTLFGGGYFIPRVQRLLEEAVLKILIQNYDSRHKIAQSNGEPLTNSGFQFAMRRSLFEAFLSEPLLKNSEEMRIEIILRTNSCALLKNLKVTKRTVNILLRKRADLKAHKCCITCGKTIYSNKRLLSDDCIGLWILMGHNTRERSLRLFKKSNMNSPGQFSLRFGLFASNITTNLSHPRIFVSFRTRFYQLALHIGETKEEEKSPTEAKRIVQEINCSSLHL